jgi:hypothetical protein
MESMQPQPARPAARYPPRSTPSASTAARTRLLVSSGDSSIAGKPGDERQRGAGKDQKNCLGDVESCRQQRYRRNDDEQR